MILVYTVAYKYIFKYININASVKDENIYDECKYVRFIPYASKV